MGTTTTIETARIHTMCSSDWLTSSGVFAEQPRTEKKAPPPSESDNSYEDVDGSTDTGADYGPKNITNKKLSMCEPKKPDGEDWDEDDLGDVSDPDNDTYDFAPRQLRKQVARFADDAGIFLAHASKKTPVPPDAPHNGCDGDVPDGRIPEGNSGSSGSSSPAEPYDLPGLPPSWDDNLAFRVDDPKIMYMNPDQTEGTYDISGTVRWA